MSSKALFSQIVADGWTGLERMKADGRQESLHLEFKQKNPKTPDLDKDLKGKVSKVISGFANTEGGVLLLGVNSQRPGAEGPDVMTGLVPTPQAANFQDALNRHLVEITTPTVQGIETVVIQHESGDGSGIVALYVPESLGKPHRATIGDDSSGRYFMRTESSTVIIPHSLLATLFAQVTPPILRMVARFDPSERGDTVRLWVMNKGRGAARDVALRCDMTADHGWSTIDATSLWRKRPQRYPDGSLSMVWEYGDVIYPGDMVEVIINRVMYDKTTQQRGGCVCIAKFKGAIYSSNGPTVPFDENQIILTTDHGNSQKVFPVDPP